MLKIKDNVDLKELEKYGFYCNQCRFTNKNYSYISRCNSYVNKLFVHDDRHLSFNNPSFEVYDVLFDMISDGLIEKVKNKRK